MEILLLRKLGMGLTGVLLIQLAAFPQGVVEESAKLLTTGRNGVSTASLASRASQMTNVVPPVVQDVSSAVAGPEANLLQIPASARNVLSPVQEVSAIVSAPAVVNEVPGFRAKRMEDILQEAFIQRLREQSAVATPSAIKQDSFSRHQGLFSRNTFQALSWDNSRYSGAVFKINYEGKEEIYGVVAAHVLTRHRRDDRFLTQHIKVVVYVNEKPRIIPAEVVQVGAPDMVDLALIKFHPEDEILFEPLVISEQKVEEGQSVKRYGFAFGRPIYESEQPVKTKNNLRFTSVVSGWKENRNGFCGGAVVNEKNELVGIHNGSCQLNWDEGLGYAVHAKFLRVLVEAFHQGEKAVFPFTLGGNTLLMLRPDQYVTEVIFLDETQNALQRIPVRSKSDYEALEPSFERNRPHYVQITVRRVQWKTNRGSGVLLTHKYALIDPGLKRYIIDVATRQIVSQSKYTAFGNFFFRSTQPSN